MFKYFRKIRLRLVAQKKLTTYLTYAFGEIALVMVGILLALQVSTWNENRKERDQEQQYLHNFVADLNQQLMTLDGHIKFESVLMADADAVLAQYYLNGDFSDLGDLYSRINDLATRSTFTKSNSTFVELKSSGNLNVIRNTELRSKLIQHYQELDLLESRVQNNNTNFVDGVIAPNIFSNSVYNREFLTGPLKTILSVKSSAINEGNLAHLIALSEGKLKNPEDELYFFNLINFRLVISTYHKSKFIDFEDETDQILELILKEMGK